MERNWPDDEPEPGSLTIKPLYELPDWALAETDPWRNTAAPRKSAPESGPATRALAETYERYAAELAEIEDLRRNQR
jgi:hypothetical protein